MRLKIIEPCSFPVSGAAAINLWPSRVVEMPEPHASRLVSLGAAEQTTDELTLGSRAGRGYVKANDEASLTIERSYGWPLGRPPEEDA